METFDHRYEQTHHTCWPYCPMPSTHIVHDICSWLVKVKMQAYVQGRKTVHVEGYICFFNQQHLEPLDFHPTM